MIAHASSVLDAGLDVYVIGRFVSFQFDSPIRPGCCIILMMGSLGNFTKIIAQIGIGIVFILLAAGCGQDQSVQMRQGVSISRRGESLAFRTELVPTMILLPNPTAFAPTQPGTSEILDPAETVEASAGPIDVCATVVNRQFESGLVEGINLTRMNYGLPPLAEQSQLNEAARDHSQKMACLGYFSHNDPVNGLPEERLRQVGYQFTSVGEVIAASYLSPEEVLQAWLASEAHRENLLSGQFTQIGVGYAYSENSEHGQYWTVLLGNP